MPHSSVIEAEVKAISGDIASLSEQVYFQPEKPPNSGARLLSDMIGTRRQLESMVDNEKLETFAREGHRANEGIKMTEALYQLQDTLEDLDIWVHFMEEQTKAIAQRERTRWNASGEISQEKEHGSHNGNGTQTDYFAHIRKTIGNGSRLLQGETLTEIGTKIRRHAENTIREIRNRTKTREQRERLSEEIPGSDIAIIHVRAQIIREEIATIAGLCVIIDTTIGPQFKSDRLTQQADHNIPDSSRYDNRFPQEAIGKT